jgi:metal-sulfur cluster biosynthetic enzyme
MEVDPDAIWQRLRRMKDPMRHEDIVSMGIVRDVVIHGGTVTIEISPVGDDRYQTEALMDAIRREVGSLDGIGAVQIRQDQSSEAQPPAAVQLNVLETPPDSDGGGFSLKPEGDTSDWGQPEGPEAELDIPQDRYDGWPPVFQWEVDPADPEIERGEAEVVVGAWEYSIWWQTHPAGLVYASIQALSEDMARAGEERPHPMGRNVAVNLVYDSRREGVVAIYGTARDFRPFVEAFRQAFDLTNEE